MIKIKQKTIYIKALFLLFFGLANLNSNAWLGSSSVKIAKEKHDELYEKFVPEIEESPNIKAELILKNLGALIQVLYKYDPETPHCKAYFEALDNLENKVTSRSLINSFLVGLPVGFLNFYALNRGKYMKTTLVSAIISGLLFSILNVIKENKSYGKSPYFDRFLNKHDNYFDNLGIESITRMLGSYGMFLLGGLLGCSGSIFINDKLK